MSLPKLSNASSSRGAQMGRSDIHALDRDAPIKLHLVRVKLYDGCYDEGGAYWGGPSDLWRVRSTEQVELSVNRCTGLPMVDHVEFFIRAESREEAKREILGRGREPRTQEAHDSEPWYLRATFFR